MTRVLVVDDNEANIYFLRVLLESQQWTVDSASQGIEALEHARKQPPDLIVSDLLMPGMDGFELLRHWKADDRLRQVPFIVYSATYVDSEDERLAVGLGADDFILKPSEPNEFLARVDEVLRRRAAVPTYTGTDGADQTEGSLLKLYSERLVQKLEKKSLELEQANRALQADILRRQSLERELLDREARLRVLHALGEATRTTTDLQAALPAAMSALGEYLKVERCLFARVDGDRCTVSSEYTRNCASMLGGQPLSRCAGPSPGQSPSPKECVIVDDVETGLPSEKTDSNLAPGIRAYVFYPLARDAIVKAAVIVHSAEVRRWSASEVALIEEVAQRCWSFIESKESENKLRDQEALLRLAGRAAKLGGWSIDLPGFEGHWSDEVCAIHEVPFGTNLHADEAIEFCAPEYRETVARKVQRCAVFGEPFDLEFQIITAKGRKVWVRGIGHPDPGPDGGVARLVGAFQDIDEQRKLQEQLRQAQKMEAVGHLASGVAHDFNNILSIILGYAALILEELSPQDPLRPEIEEIHLAGKRATDLTSKLLTFSRQKLVELCALNIGEVARGVETMIRRLLGAQIELSIVTELSVGRVLADPGQIEQVIMNLAINARDAMPDGGTLSIETIDTYLDAVYCADQFGVEGGPYVMLAVTDTGIGMDSATQERIFEPFFTTKGKGKGTGLGLATVFGIVKQSQGHIRVDTEPGKGTTFKLYFPRTDRVAKSIAEAMAPPTTLAGTESILLVEDDDPVRGVTAAILRRQGYFVIEASNGNEALLMGEQISDELHLLITNLAMPRMSGRQLVELLHLARPELRVLYVSGDSEHCLIEQGEPRPASAYLAKPIEPNSLLSKVREVLDQKASSSRVEKRPT